MRSSIFFACAAFLLGCGSSSSNDEPAPVPSPSCGSGDSLCDPPPPAKADAPKGNPRLSLLYIGDKGPVADLAVVFQDADGNVLESTTTNAEGRAFSREGIATQATIQESGAPLSLLTYTGLEEGDEIVLAPQTGGTGYVSGSLPLLAGATRYHLDANECAGQRLTAAGTHVVSLDQCSKDADYILLGVARDDQNTSLGYAFKSGVKPMASTSLTWTTPKVVTLAMQHPNPSGVSFWHVFDGKRVGTSVGAEPASASSFTLRVAAEATDVDVMLVDRSEVGELETERTLELRLPVQANIAADSTAALPTPSTIGVTLAETSRPKLVWSWSSPLTATGGRVAATWRQQTSNGWRSAGTWTFVVPPSATSVVAPRLPVDFAALPSGIPEGRALEFALSATPSDYKAFRTHYRNGASPKAVKARVRTYSK